MICWKNNSALQPIRAVVKASLVIAALGMAPGSLGAETADREALLQTLRQVHANYLAADEDGDGNLTMLQFRTFIDANAEIDFAMARQVKRFRGYRQAFLRVDLNSDGSLSWQEYVTVLRSAGGNN